MSKVKKNPVSLTLKQTLENEISYPDLFAKKQKARSVQVRKFIVFGLATQTA